MSDQFKQGADSLMAHWNKVSGSGDFNPVEMIAFGTTVNNAEQHWVVVLNREPTSEEGVEAPVDLDGVPVEYFTPPGMQSWSPPKAP